MVVVGGGAAGFFAALQAARTAPTMRIALVEKASRFLNKVAISGGGRCNVTNAAPTLEALLSGYPRGAKELRGPFKRFDNQATAAWFTQRGVPLVAEADGRMFPQANTSAVVLDCLMREARGLHIALLANTALHGLTKGGGLWELATSAGVMRTPNVVIALGGLPKHSQFDFATALGLEIVTPVPSLFSFNIALPELHALAGVAVPMGKMAAHAQKPQEGPAMVTHWGLSGPAVLKSSAWHARALHEANYTFTAYMNWLGEGRPETVLAALMAFKQEHGRKTMVTKPFPALPNRLWDYLLATVGIAPTARYGDVTKASLSQLANVLTAQPFPVQGKSTNKDEFVTAGGIALREVDFKTMQSRKHPGLYFAGEVLDIDGITGGYNFQAAWTTGYVAGLSVGEAFLQTS